MKFGDYSPPLSPSLEQQRDALKKGLGRALQWALSGRLDERLLLEACLHDQRFDTQFNSSRGDWFWQMIHAMDAAERFRVPVLHALFELSDDDSSAQLCELAAHYAKAGDDAFRARLYEIVEQRPITHSPWRGEEEIVALDGEAAFLFAAQVRGRLLVDGNWDWDDENLIDFAAERFGKERVIMLLQASTDEAIRRFRECWRQHRRERDEQPNRRSHKESMAAISVHEILQTAESVAVGRHVWFRSWGRYAQEADLQAVLERLWVEREPRIVANLLSIFSDRPLPQFDARLIDFCRQDDRELRRRAFAALKPNAHPLAREFALCELDKGACDAAVVSLFVNNFRTGDERRILDYIEPPDDADELHWLLIDVIQLLEKNSEADCSRLGVVAYALNPCEECRFDAARLLLNQRAAPDWLSNECQYDSGEDCRELVAKSTDQ